MADPKRRVFVLGWDGATFDLIKPWVAQGHLPTIARLMEAGSYGPLASTQPPMTFPAWSSFMTGKNPGKHGIFDFTRRRSGSYDLEFVNGGKRRAATFWRLLSDAGLDVISISLPCTFPPEPVRGVMISGFDAPGGGPGSHVDAGGMYPPELYSELERSVGHHPIGASVIKDINEGRAAAALAEVERTIRQKAATAKYLLGNRPWDCFMILFGESDMLGHQLWKYADPNSPLFTTQPAGFRDGLLRVYEELDRQAAELLALLPADTTVLVMSDHGFGGVSDWVIYPNCWLAERGFLRFRSAMRRWISRTLDRAKVWGLSNIPAGARRLIYKLGGRRLGQFEAGVRFGMLDWEGTQAYFEENPYYPFLWINLKGRQPQGTVAPGAEYEDLRTRLIRELEAWKHPDSGEPIVEKAWRREEIYNGPSLDDAPDVVVKWALNRGYSYAFKLSAKSADLRWTERLDPKKAENLQYYTNKSGSHRDLGIFVAYGPGIRPGVNAADAHIIDLAPTVLSLFGLEVPTDMDGRVLTEVLESAAPVAAPSSESAKSPATDPGQLGSRGARGDESSSYSAGEEEMIAARLKALGYVD
jgi:predicted AlkP superfamily phosphohydrolase/phosphomutase